MNVSTTVGSNWLPAQRFSSASAGVPEIPKQREEAVPHLGTRRERWHGASRCQAAPRTAHAFAEITNGGSGSLSLQSSRSAVRLSGSRPAT